MSPQSAFPRVMRDMKVWLKTHPELRPLHGGQVFRRLPTYAEKLDLPILRLYRSGGAVQRNSEAPIQDIRVSVEVWANEWKKAPLVEDLVAVLESVCSDVEGGVVLNPNGNTIMDNASFNVAYESPDPDTGWPRYVCDIVVTVKASTPTVVAS